HDMALLYLVVQLYKGSFGTPHFMPWDHLEAAGHWYIDTMAPDGWTLDFGDSNKTHAWGTSAPLMATLAREWALDEPTGIDPCLAQAYWARKYYGHGFNKPWMMHSWMARDWPAIIAACDVEPPPAEITTYPVGGWSMLKTYTPGVSGLTEGLAPTHKGRDADKTLLAASSVPNTYAHMESDFGTLIWSAQGSRLLADIGYGSQSKDIYSIQKKIDDVVYEQSDNNPMGHSTLYIPEATFEHSSNGLLLNSSQVKGGIGTIAVGQWGDMTGVHMDGAYVYGKIEGNPAYEEAEEYGWLEAFDRWLIQLPGGHFLVADSFLARADRGPVSAAETWMFAHDPFDDPADCKYNKLHVDATRLDDHTVQLEPACVTVFYEQQSAAVGQILAASRTPGQFTEPEVFENRKQWSGSTVHKRVRYEPETPVDHDARVFALLAAPSAEALPVATLLEVTCADPDDVCFDLTMDGVVTAIDFDWDGARHVL
ncbi:MAG: hypothetical protein QF464_17970, partial [Myxococcota bacterium]|nr:hypothetical protein [Myxococcota bacterium]